MVRNIALIPAAGVGKRFASELPKQYFEIHQLPILLHTLRCLSIRPIDDIYLILSPQDEHFKGIQGRYKDFFGTLLHQTNSSQHLLSTIYVGGKTRAESVLNALNYLEQKCLASDKDWILVHDAVRCCLPKQRLLDLIATAEQTQQGVILAKKVVDTVKQVNRFQRIEKTIDRELLWLAQTPQIFLLEELRSAYANVTDFSLITDEASLFENFGEKPLVVVSDDRNLKITTLEDIHYATFLLLDSMGR